MKTIKLATVVYTMALAILATLILFGCSKDDDQVLPSNQSQYEDNNEVLRHQEKAGLLLLVELQKFHSDVYSVMNNFNREITFEDLSKRDSYYQKLLANKALEYGLEDPSVGRPIGDYADGDIRKLYLQFIGSHENNMEKALIYASEMEKSILDDINTWITFTSHSDIVVLYESLISETQSQIRILEDKINKYESVEAEALLINDY
jgi:hypothetical protein